MKPRSEAEESEMEGCRSDFLRPGWTRQQTELTLEQFYTTSPVNSSLDIHTGRLVREEAKKSYTPRSVTSTPRRNTSRSLGSAKSSTSSGGRAKQGAKLGGSQTGERSSGVNLPLLQGQHVTQQSPQSARKSLNQVPEERALPGIYYVDNLPQVSRGDDSASGGEKDYGVPIEITQDNSKKGHDRMSCEFCMKLLSNKSVKQGASETESQISASTTQRNSESKSKPPLQTSQETNSVQPGDSVSHHRTPSDHRAGSQSTLITNRTIGFLTKQDILVKSRSRDMDGVSSGPGICLASTGGQTGSRSPRRQIPTDLHPRGLPGSVHNDQSPNEQQFTSGQVSAKTGNYQASQWGHPDSWIQNRALGMPRAVSFYQDEAQRRRQPPALNKSCLPRRSAASIPGGILQRSNTSLMGLVYTGSNLDPAPKRPSQSTTLGRGWQAQRLRKTHRL